MKATKLLTAIVAAIFILPANVNAQTWTVPSGTWTSTNNFMGTGSGAAAGDFNFNTQGSTRMTILGGTTNPGFVGIGLTSPSSFLHVKGNNSSNAFLTLELYNPTFPGTGSTGINLNGGALPFSIYSDKCYLNSSCGLHITATSGSSPRGMHIVNNLINFGAASGTGTFYGAFNFDDKVVIGTVSSAPSGYLLYVKDGILTEKVRVATSGTTDWSDFVFDKSYKLKSLNEVEAFINKNHHLPEIPSTEEVNKNGVDLLEMDAKLLQKIEELTLYMIEMKKENEKIIKANKALEHEVALLKAQVTAK